MDVRWYAREGSVPLEVSGRCALCARTRLGMLELAARRARAYHKPLGEIRGAFLVATPTPTLHAFAYEPYASGVSETRKRDWGPAPTGSFRSRRESTPTLSPLAFAYGPKASGVSEKRRRGRATLPSDRASPTLGMIVLLRLKRSQDGQRTSRSGPR